MSSHDSDTINFDKLERQLYDAVEADSKYWRENDAKMRAIGQKVGSYDDFRDMVLAAHIKPLDKDDKFTDVKFQQPWNSQAKKCKEASKGMNNAEPYQETTKFPITGQAFVQHWRHSHKTTEEQYNYMLDVGADCFSKIFKTEISFGLLGDMIVALNKQFKDTDAKSVLAILEHLSHAGRFSLSVQFLSKIEKENSTDLFVKLKNTPDFRNEDDRQILDKVCSLENLYGIK